MTKQHSRTPWVTVFSLSLSLGVLAADPPQPVDVEPTALSTVVVTASRANDNALDIPATTTVVDRQAIERRQSQTPNTILKEEPGIWSVNVAAQGSPILRGQIGNRVLYLWDGVRINNGALFGGPNGFFNQFPVDGVDRIEVVRGSGSVQYGSDAIGGVINVLSKQAEFTNQFAIGGDVYGRYSSNDDGNMEALNVRLSNDTFAMSAGIDRQEVGSYRGATMGKMDPSGFNTLGGYVNLAWRPEEGQTFRLSWIGNDRTEVESYVQSKLNANGAPRFFSPIERRGIVKFDYTAEDLGALSSELKVYGYYQYYQAERARNDFKPPAFNTKTTYTDQAVAGAGIQNVTKTSDKTRLVYGVDYRHEDLKSYLLQQSINLGTGGSLFSEPPGNTPDGTYDVLSTFATAEFRPTDSLLFTAGLRYENTSLNSNPTALDVIPDAGYSVKDLALDETWNSVTWNVGSVLNLNKEWDLVANVGSGFRAPTFSDLLSTGTPVFSSRTASLPTPSLDPEKSITYELGTRVHTRTFAGSLTGYYTQLSDIVSQSPSGTVTIPGQGDFIATRNSNSTKGYVTGAELALAWQFSRQWSFFANSTYTYGQDETADVPLRFIPPLNGTFGIRFESASGRWWAEVVECWAARLNRHAPNDELDAGFSRDPALGSPNSTDNPPLTSKFDIPGFWVTNVRGGVKVWEQGLSSLSLTLGLNNIFNTSYREAYAQQQLEAPGFGVVVGARLTF